MTKRRWWVCVGVGIAMALACSRPESGRRGGEPSRGSAGDASRAASNPSPPSPVVKLFGGGRTTCALREDGRVACWGNNESYELGEGFSGELSRRPVVVRGVNDVSTLASGLDHVCALLKSGSVACWGGNTYGQLGIGRSHNGDASRKPLLVVGLTDVSQLAVGTEHACALRRGGDVACWGGNGSGQLGVGKVGSLGYRHSITTLPDMADVVEIAAAWDFSCARNKAGAVKCWGSRLMTGLPESGTEPVTIIKRGAVSLGARGSRACIRQSDGAVICWGNFQKPKVIPKVKAAEIFVGSNHACALESDGTLKCWGHNNAGQMGDGTKTRDSEPENETVHVVQGLGAPVRSVVVGSDSTCVLAGQRVLCWGGDYKGELGLGRKGTEKCSINSRAEIDPCELRPAPVVGL
jgi:alpha-tubulin suppressor-like RCC1 family protein